MKQENYHHGDLKNALIEAGIKIVGNEGMKALSLRKVAATCGVSHAAPYNHFKTKEELLEAMQQHITNQFAEQLQETLENHTGQTDVLIELGCAYLRFFITNPHYYSFIFGQVGISCDFDSLENNSYPPFNIFKKAAIDRFRSSDKPESEYMKSILAMWSVAHGFTGFATMNTIKYSGDWENLLSEILHDNVCP